MKKGDKIICIKDFPNYAIKDEVFFIAYNNIDSISIRSNINTAEYFTVTKWAFKAHFIELGEYRERRINDILK